MKVITQTTDQILLASIEPFRRRDHWQRATRLLLQALRTALAVAVLELGTYKLGLPIPLPSALGVTAAATLLAGLALTAWQRPSIEQTARLLDRRLGLREQLHTALEVDERAGPLAARLHEQARDTLRRTIPARALPWPSLRHEYASLVVLLGLVAASLLAPYFSVLHPTAADARTNRPIAAARPQSPPHRNTAARTANNPPQPGAQQYQQHMASGLRQATRSDSHLAAQFLSTPASISLATPSGTQQEQETLPSTQSSASVPQPSSQTPQGSTSKMNSGATATQRSQSSASEQQSMAGQHEMQGGQQTASPESQDQSQAGQPASPTAGSGSRSRSQGTQSQSGRNQHAQSATGTQATGQGKPGTQSHASRTGASQGGGGGSGRGTGGHSATTRGTSDTAPRSSANVTIKGGPHQSGQIALAAGKPGGTTAGDVTMTGGSAGAGSSSPGYVAPDSNAVTPADRPAVRGYFTPPSNGK